MIAIMKPERSGHLVRATLVLLIQAQVAVAQQDVSQVELARALQSEDWMESNRSLLLVAQMEPEAISEPLRGALIRALSRANTLHRRSLENGVAFGAVMDPEHRLELVHQVARLEDSRSITALAGALGTGYTAVRSVAAFGEPAADPVLEALATTTSSGVRDDALVALRFMVERQSVQPLSKDTRVSIETAAKRHLAAGESVTNLWRAAELALALGDPELRRRVKILSEEQDSVIEWGVKPEWVADTQRRLSAALAGKPPLPRWNQGISQSR